MKKILFLALAFIFFSYGQSSKSAMAIGVNLPLTSSHHKYELTLRKRATLAQDEVNVAGGIHGRSLEIDFQDNRGDPEWFIDQPNVVLVRQSFLFEAGSGQVFHDQKAGMGFFSSFSTNEVVAVGNCVWAYHSFHGKKMKNLMKYINELGFEKEMKGSLWQLAYNEEWGKIDERDLEKYNHTSKVNPRNKKRFSRMTAENIDVLILADWPIYFLNVFVQQLESRNLNIPVIIAGISSKGYFELIAAASSEKIYAILGMPAWSDIENHDPHCLLFLERNHRSRHYAFEVKKWEKMRSPIPLNKIFLANDSSSGVAHFVKRWQAKYSQEATSYYTIHAYDAIILMAEALKLSNETHSSVKKACAKLKDVSTVLYGKATADLLTCLINVDISAHFFLEDGKLAV